MLKKLFIAITILCCIFLLFGCSKDEKGEPGVGIQSAVINDDGDLIITYTNGNVVNAGHVTDTGNNGIPKIVETHKCGENATWTFFDDKTFEISGSGEISIDNGMRAYAQFAHKLIIEDGIVNVERIGNGFFLKKIEISHSVTRIGNEAFSGFNVLTSITIPDSVTNIGRSAFHSCSSLTSIEIPNSVTSIGSSSFYNCSSLTNIIIPASVTHIEANTFYGCSSLTSITIPDSVTSIGSSSFYNCSSLTNIIIPASVTHIEANAFDGCTSLTIYCEAQSKPNGWNRNWNSSGRPVVWGYTGE